jgi:ketosteroid isomerase-like protein
MESALEDRIRRIEAYEQIRSITARYASALDERDLDAFVEVFAPDGALGGTRMAAHGRDEIRQGILDIVDRWTGPTIHFLGNQSIELDPSDPDQATGLIYCRAEHEFHDRWVVQLLRYKDVYVRRENRWYIGSREAQSWYATDLLERPTGGRKVRWGDGPAADAPLPEAWPTYRRYWAERH